MCKTIYDLHTITLAIAGIVTLIVLAVMCVAFMHERRSRRDAPNSSAMPPRLEIIWTLIPIVILVGLALPAIVNVFHT